MFPSRRIRFSTALAFGAVLLTTGSAEEPLVAPLPRFDPNLPPTMLKDVEVKPSRTIGIRPEENETYYRLLWHLGLIPEEGMKESDIRFRHDRIDRFEIRTRDRILKEFERDERSRGAFLKRLEEKLEGYRADPLSYPLVQDAFNDATACQGKVVSFRGYSRRAISYPAGPNNYGIETLYEIWLFEDDAKGLPVVIVCTEVPDGFPLNFPETEPLDGVSVRGYFFKLYAYQGREGLHAVPLLLAKRVEWNPPAAAGREFPGWAYTLVVVLGLGLLYLLLFRSGTERRRLSQARRRMAVPGDNPFSDHSFPPESDSNS